MIRVYAWLMLAIAALGAACSSGINAPNAGSVVTEWRRVGAFNGLEVARAMEVIIREGASDSIRLDVSQGYLGYIRTEVVNGVLRVYVDDAVDLSNLEENNVTITVPTLKSIAASGASIVRTEDTLRSADLVLIASGASVLNLVTVAGRIDLVSSGASVWDLAGRVDRFYADPVSGASVIRAYGLTAATTRAVLSGASILETTTTDSLRVVASGASIVRYKGDPHVSADLTGGSLLQDQN